MDSPASSPPHILIADDEPDVLKALRLLLKGEGYTLETAASAAGILEALHTRDFDAVLMDLNYTRGTTTGQEGLDLLSRIRERDASLPVIVMTAWSSVELAVEAMQRGARDFVSKPWKNERLLSILRTQLELGSALRRSRYLEHENRWLREDAAHRLIAESKAMEPVLRLIAQTGPSDANILITGENGTGKNVVAHALHEASAHAAKAMMTVNMGSLSGSVFESELFGHAKGAFTDAKTERIGRFQLADGGTLFLDEIASIPLEQQQKLLRVLETGEFEPVGSSRTYRADVRILSATNAHIGQEVTEGRFRQDLLYRLNTVEIHLPALRERREDIPLLARFFLDRHSRHYRKAVTNLDASVMNALLEYPWPGNVRELDHMVERAVLMAREDGIRVGDLGFRTEGEENRSFEAMSLDEAERALIQRAVSRYEGNISGAAKALGLSRSALYRRLEKHALQ